MNKVIIFILDNIKMSSTSSSDLNKIMKDETDFNGVFLSDEIPKLKTGSYIINLLSSNSNQVMGHWTCFRLYPNKSAIYYDSTGFPPPINAQKKIKDFCKGKEALYSTYITQKFDTTNCGQLCCDFLKNSHTLDEAKNWFQKNYILSY